MTQRNQRTNSERKDAAQHFPERFAASGEFETPFAERLRAKLVVGTFVLAIAAAGALAQTPVVEGQTVPKDVPSQRDAPSEQAQARIAAQIQKDILTLPNYGLFDWITFSLRGYDVILNGYASRPVLKDSAQRVAEKVEGVAAVENRIEVLPLSRVDDQVRTEAYFRIYGQPTLDRYNPNRGAPLWISPTRVMSGLTLDPPVGFHPIHIVVKNGHLTLFGTVLNDGDRSIAEQSKDSARYP